MKRVAIWLLLLLNCALVIVLLVHTDLQYIFNKTETLVGSVFFVDSVTELSLKQTYTQAKKELVDTNKKKTKAEIKAGLDRTRVKVLVVPGHDEQFSGTTYNGLSELKLTIELGEKLYALLKKEPFLDVYISQTKEGYVPEIWAYFTDNRDAILAFLSEKKALMENLIGTSEIKPVVNVQHNFAPAEGAIRLYGINKWANDHDIDIVIHIHFNDYPGRKKTAPGRYSGFAIYVPERQYSNAKGSESVAASIRKRLASMYPPSNLPKEDMGIIEDQELIALGSRNTLDSASVLIEYGYIYEPAFSRPDTRAALTDDLALQTYLGIMDFFGEKTNAGGTYATRLVPYAWTQDLTQDTKAPRDILSLQATLTLAGVYPPTGRSKNDCGLTGFFGPCTKEAVRLFQEKYGIRPSDAFVGAKTRQMLAEIYQDKN